MMVRAWGCGSRSGDEAGILRGPFVGGCLCLGRHPVQQSVNWKLLDSLLSNLQLVTGGLEAAGQLTSLVSLASVEVGS